MSEVKDEETIHIDPSENPDQANAAIKAVLEDRGLPHIDVPEMSVDLMYGIERNGVIEKTALLRELNGLDEEYLAKFPFLKEPLKYVSALLDRGVEEIGGEKPNRLELSSLTIGDRELLALKIRITSIGRYFDLTLTCPQCEASNDIKFDLVDDIKIRQPKFDTPMNKLELSNGKILDVRFPTGADQMAVVADGRTKMLPEMNSIMIASVIGIDISDARKMSSKERREIITFITENQPGPQFDEGVKSPCANCGETFLLRISLADLFPI